MPLLPGSDSTIVQHNIREMLQAGHPESVAVAAALSNAREHGAAHKMLKMKRPSLHPGHPFNSKKAPSNVPTQKIAPFKAADEPNRDFRGEKVVNGVKMRT